MEKMASRKEKRKAARQEKKQLKHQALLHHQISRKQKVKDNSRMVNVRKNVQERGDFPTESDSDRDNEPQEPRSDNMTSDMSDSDFSLTENDSERDELLDESDELLDESAFVSKKSSKGDKDLTSKKTKFEEFLEMETIPGGSLEEDLETERRLAKKLKVKNGKLRDDDDGLNSLFEGLSSVLDLSEQVYEDNTDSEAIGESTSVKKTRKKEKKKEKKSRSKPVSDSDTDASPKEKLKEGVLFDSGEEGAIKDVDGAEIKISKKKKRKRKTLDSGLCSGNDSSDKREPKNIPLENDDQGEANTRTEKTDAIQANRTQGSSKYVAPHLRSVSEDPLQEYLHIRRRIRGLLNRLSESNVESITGEIFSIFQSVTRAVGSQIIIEEVLTSCTGGPRGNEQYASVFAAFVAGTASMVGIDFGAKLLASFAKSFEDEYSKEDNLSLRNLSLFLSYLCIFGVCSCDLIYDFLIKLSKRLTEVDVSTILTILQCCGMKLRGDNPAAMKDFIISVQGRVNDLKAGSSDVEATKYGKRMEFMLETICDIKNNKRRSKEDTPQHTRVKKWLQKLRVEDITIRGIKWSKLLDPEKKGQWWFSVDVSSPAEDGKVARKIDRDVHEAQKMLELAAKQRMNTDTRRAIFCIIMSAEDYIDAFEQLLSLNLQGKQDREVMRVLLECCLQEKVFNKYYTALASKLCSHDKNNKFSLQYCIWDQFKELESMPLLRSMHLAKFVAEMLGGFSLSLAALKVVDLIDVTQLTAKRIMHFRMLFEAIFEQPDSVVWNMFTRVAVTPELEDLRNGMEFFIREYVVTANKDIGKKFKLAKKALNNIQGVLM